ncbi:hypothetical protein JW926_03810 [Candidatus Sumerlaeota bacterium]|nr:hypothetical protein [Candidatus Sumerlaeota bacterium]
MKTKTGTEKIQDPIIEEVRKAGEEIAKEAGYDLHVMCERLRKSEKRGAKPFKNDSLRNKTI